MKESKSGMRSPKMPSEHHEKSVGMVNSCDLKYGGEFNNPEELKKNADGLASFVKKKQMKY